MGLGNRPNAAEALEPEDEEELYNCGAFGTENPDSLLSILWLMNTVHFGLRGVRHDLEPWCFWYLNHLWFLLLAHYTQDIGYLLGPFPI
jgi:hypothetical protein